MSQKVKITMKSKAHPFDLLALKAKPSEFATGLSDDEIGKVLDYLSDHYYNGLSLVDDKVFDDLQDILKARNPNHPSLKKVGASIVPISSADLASSSQEKQEPVNDVLTSISGLLGSGPSITNPVHRIKAQLPYWMGSMSKIKPGTSALDNWLSKFPGPKVLSDKMDGTSALLFYKINGSKLDVSLFTRGDGAYGQDISCLIPYLRLPVMTVKTIQDALGGVQQLAIRAELIMSKANFEQFQAQVPNARNLVSGIANSKTIQTDLVKLVDFVAYELIGCQMRQSQQFLTLFSWGYTVAPYDIRALTVDESFLTTYFAERKKKSLYEIDGVIVCDDAVHPRNTSENPKYAVAFKMMVDESEQVAETTVVGVSWNIQKDGYLFPVIHVQPVFLSGITIQNASGKNAKFMVDNCIGTGSIVKVARDGDVIPGIFEVVTPSPTGIAELPDIIDMPFHWTASGVDIVLDDIESNPEVQLKRLISFFEKMGVTGFGEGMITRCFQHPKLNTITKILQASV